jgi:hypothetical protein
MSRKSGKVKPTMQSIKEGARLSGAQRKAARVKVGTAGVKHEGGRGEMNTCPICFYRALPAPPRDYLICPSCGTEFGADDVGSSHSELRAAWEAAGRPWFSQHTAQPGEGKISDAIC